jgi:hypothetical protein
MLEAAVDSDHHALPAFPIPNPHSGTALVCAPFDEERRAGVRGLQPCSDEALVAQKENGMTNEEPESDDDDDEAHRNFTDALNRQSNRNSFSSEQWNNYMPYSMTVDFATID